VQFSSAIIIILIKNLIQQPYFGGHKVFGMLVPLHGALILNAEDTNPLTTKEYESGDLA
jgi:hypothetical protein